MTHIEGDQETEVGVCVMRMLTQSLLTPSLLSPINPSIGSHSPRIPKPFYIPEISRGTMYKDF